MNKLKKAIPDFYKKEDITFFELNSDFISAFDLHLKTEAGLCRNTIVRYMKCFKRITNMALAKEWMRKDPFYGYKMAQDETDPVFLTYPELKSVMEKEFTIPPPGTGARHFCLRILHRAGLCRCIHTYKRQPCAGQQRRMVDQKGACKAGAQTPGILRQQYPPAAGSAGHSKKIRRPSRMPEEKPLPAGHLQSTDEQLPERNRRPMQY